MDNIAYMIGGLSVTWHGLIMALAVAGGVITALLLSGVFGVRRFSVLLTLLGSFVSAPLLSRIVYWYCCPEKYHGFLNALLDFGHGGESLLGAIAGVLLTAVLVAAGTKTPFLRLVDCLAPAGALAIAIGRLSSFFTSDDYGKITFDNPERQHFPFSVCVEGADGMQVWRFPTFFYESIAGFCIFAVLIYMAFRRCGSENASGKSEGLLFFMFVSMLCCSQIVFESTRYDVLYLRSNGFVSLFQIVGAVGEVAVFVILAIRFCRNSEKSDAAKQIAIFSAIVLIFLGNAGYMEYLVQRHANLYYVYYPLMAICMAGVCAATAILCYKDSRLSS